MIHKMKIRLTAVMTAVILAVINLSALITWADGPDENITLGDAVQICFRNPVDEWGQMIPGDAGEIYAQLLVRSGTKGIASVYLAVNVDGTAAEEYVYVQNSENTDENADGISRFIITTSDQSGEWMIYEADSEKIIAMTRPVMVMNCRYFQIDLGFTDLEGNYYSDSVYYEIAGADPEPEMLPEEIPDSESVYEETSPEENIAEEDAAVETAEETTAEETTVVEETAGEETTAEETAEEETMTEETSEDETAAEEIMTEELSVEEASYMEAETKLQEETDEQAEEISGNENSSEETETAEEPLTDRENESVSTEAADEDVTEQESTEAEETAETETTAAETTEAESIEAQTPDEAQNINQEPEADYYYQAYAGQNYSGSWYPQYYSSSGYTYTGKTTTEKQTTTAAETEEETKESVEEKETETTEEPETETKAVNTEGSSYDLSALADINHMFLQSVGDIVITEQNMDKLVDDSICITVSRNGEVFELERDVDYAVKITGISDNKKLYRYTIYSDVFSEDGVYRLFLNSEDESGNINSNEENGDEIAFSVDRTEPLIIAGTDPVEDGDYLSGELMIKDNIQLAEVEIYADGEKIDYEVDGENYSFRIPLGTEEKELTVVARDSAGNVYERTIGGYAASAKTSGKSSAGIMWYAAAAAAAAAAGTLVFRKYHRRKRTHTVELSSNR